MYIETEGIVLRQYKISSGRRMILMFSNKLGKISAGTNISEKNRSKSALILRPFTYGKYELKQVGEAYFINSGEVIRSHYKIGEDIDKYMEASYVMELTSKVLPEEASAPDIFNLLLNFLTMIEKRRSKYRTLTIGYIVKLLVATGSIPQLGSCVICGKRESLVGFCAEEGGMVCINCISSQNHHKDILIFPSCFDIVNVLKYLMNNPLNRLEKLALEDNIAAVLKDMLRIWLACHLDIKDLKSEGFI
ncbi:MAG: DNA repair protein RecO [Anaerovoracaceae bacterium]|jgi:DNA repair protein RecO (recombination protein O)